MPFRYPGEPPPSLVGYWSPARTDVMRWVMPANRDPAIVLQLFAQT
jgi:hypothetical protein